MEATLDQQIQINHAGEPTLAGTSITVKEIMAKLTTGMDLNEVVKVCHLADDLALDIAVEYAETSPSNSALALLLQQYRQQQKQKIKRILQNFKQHCQQQYGQRLVKLVLFGSQARGDFKPSSDIDVLVVLEDPLDEQSDLDKILDFQVDVSLNEAELLNCIFMGENEFQTCQSLLVRNIQQDGIVFYECNPTGVDGRGWR